MNEERPVALVTGSTSGIGAAIAGLLARSGYLVVIHSRKPVEACRALTEQFGPTAHYVRADLLQDSERARVIDEAVSRWGRLDVLVNNAGTSRVIPLGSLAEAHPSEWREMYELNVIAPFHLVSLAEPHLRSAASARAGRPAAVVNVSSHAGVRPKGASIPYAAAKAALNHTTRLLALTLAPDIRVNAIAPGLVDTPLTADRESVHRLWRERAPMRRAARPDDIAQIVMMLIKSDYLTGEVVIADGGLNLT
jgi:NAD(P)-dependent dehydrogenase (short-subunit alcohol dehydrogenase family)